jgi:hypothetical protein
MRKGVVGGFWGSTLVLGLCGACSGKSENVSSRGNDGGASGTAAGGSGTSGGSAGASAGGAVGASGSFGSDGSGGSGGDIIGTGGAAGAAFGGASGIAGAGASGGAAGIAGAGGGGAAGVSGTGMGGIGGSMPDATLVGTWVGYVENHYFPSGSDEVRIVITDGAPSGHVVFGNGMPPPPPDPNTGYPPSSGGGAAGAAGAGARPGFEVYEGFRYTILAGNVTRDRVRFKVESRELWKEWCALQTPVPLQDGSGGYGCLPNRGYASDGTRCWLDDNTEVNCGKAQLCSFGVCECTAQSCKASGYGDTVFDLDHRSNELDGSVNGIFGLHNVRLTQE